MEDAHAARRRFQPRALGRTPEEHLALERALAQRRRRRQLQSSQRATPLIFYAAQGIHDRQRLSLVESGYGGNTRFRPFSTRNSQSTMEDHGEVAPLDEETECLREIDDSEIYGIFKGLYEDNGPRPGRSPSFNYFDFAMFRAKVAAAKSSATWDAPALGVPPMRNMKPKYNRRNVRGAGWHRRGYRDHGMMWINVKAGTLGWTRGRDASENGGLLNFVKSVFHSWDSKYPEGWYCDLFYKKKSVTRLLVDLVNLGFDMDLVLVKDYFDGGETVYFKLFNEYCEQQDLGRFF